MKYLNTTGRQITINVVDKIKKQPVKVILIPGKPCEVSRSIMDSARKDYPVVQHYFKSGEITKFSDQKTVEEKSSKPNKSDDEGTKDFMLKALQESGIEEYTKLNGRNSEKSIKEAYDKMIADATEGSDNGDSGDN